MIHQLINRLNSDEEFAEMILNSDPARVALLIGMSLGQHAEDLISSGDLGPIDAEVLQLLGMKVNLPSNLNGGAPLDDLVTILTSEFMEDL